MSSPFFIECSVPAVPYLRGEVIVNSAVNLSLCTVIRRGFHKWYPDNKGLPSIEFVLIGGANYVTWVFSTEAERDAEYAKAVSAGTAGAEVSDRGSFPVEF